jgi:hypothetical protein
MTPDDTIRIMAILTAAYPQVNLARETVEVYGKFLADLPFEAGYAAAMDLISTNKWLPTVAELRRRAFTLMPETHIPTAAEAWAEVVDQVQSLGSYRLPAFSHPVIERAVKALGWRELCLTENLQADRAHFLQIYEAFREDTELQAMRLPEVKRLMESRSPARLVHANPQGGEKSALVTDLTPKEV